MLSRRALVVLCALLAVPACLASPISLDPFTLTDGTVVDPTSPDYRPVDTSADSIYMPLSNDGPMAGTAPRHGNPNGGHPRKRQLGIRSEQDDGYVV